MQDLGRIRPQMATCKERMHKHFSEIAPSYRDVRMTDLEPIQFIKKMLKDPRSIRAADIGCGAGRYDLLLFRHLHNLHLVCIDSNEAMLKETSAYLKDSGICNFFPVKAAANNLPLRDNFVDCVFTFNAIHHFYFPRFLENAARIIRRDGLIFIYTRLQSQNETSLWGRYFPNFLEKEDRLYELSDIIRDIDLTNCLTIGCVETFQFSRKATLDEILEKACEKHYSTFSLYDECEFEECLNEFEKRITSHFPNPECIEWYDGNIMLLLRSK